PHQVRREPGGEQSSFPQRLLDQAELQLLQVAQPAVDQLAGARRGTGGQVARLDEGDRQATGGGVERGPRPRDAPADDQHVETLAAQPAQVGDAPFGRQCASGEPGDGRISHVYTVRPPAYPLRSAGTRYRPRLSESRGVAGPVRRATFWKSRCPGPL